MVTAKWLIVIVGALGLATLYCASYKTSVPETVGTLVVDDADLHLGRQWEQTDCTHTLRVRNKTPEVVNVRRFESSCNCSDITPPQLRLEPHGNADVTVAISFPKIRMISTTSDSEPFAVEITPIIEQYGKLRVGGAWILDATVVPPFRMEPDVIDLGQELVVGDIPTSEPIRFMIADCRLDDLDASCQEAIGRVTIARSANRHFSLEFTPSSTLTPDHLPASFQLQGKFGQKKRAVVIDVPIQGGFVEDLVLDPPVLYIDSVPVHGLIRQFDGVLSLGEEREVDGFRDTFRYIS